MVTIKAWSPLFQILIFGLIFAPRPHMSNIACMDPNHLQKVKKCTVLAFPFNSYYRYLLLYLRIKKVGQIWIFINLSIKEFEIWHIPSLNDNKQIRCNDFPNFALAFLGISWLKNCNILSCDFEEIYKNNQNIFLNSRPSFLLP